VRFNSSVDGGISEENLFNPRCSNSENFPEVLLLIFHQFGTPFCILEKVDTEPLEWKHFNLSVCKCITVKLTFFFLGGGRGCQLGNIFMRNNLVTLTCHFIILYCF
jgi:hypothetical protein